MIGFVTLTRFEPPFFAFHARLHRRPWNTRTLRPPSFCVSRTPPFRSCALRSAWFPIENLKSKIKNPVPQPSDLPSIRQFSAPSVSPSVRFLAGTRRSTLDFRLPPLTFQHPSGDVPPTTKIPNVHAGADGLTDALTTYTPTPVGLFISLDPRRSPSEPPSRRQPSASSRQIPAVAVNFPRRPSAPRFVSWLALDPRPSTFDSPC